MKQTFSLKSVRTFAHSHDDLPAFHAAYIVLTFLAAAMFNLGFFAVVVLCHMALDIFKYREVHHLNWKRTLEGVVRESIVDVTLLIMGLTVSVYLHPSLTGMQGTKGMMLAEMTVLRGIGMMAPKLKIVYEAIKILSDIDSYLHRLHPKFGKKVSVIETVCVFALVVTIGMLIVAPLLLGLTDAQFFGILLSEMVPWKM